MKRRYMDFVPTKIEPGTTTTKKTVSRATPEVKKRPSTRGATVVTGARKAVSDKTTPIRTTDRVAFSTEKVKLGTIEDLNSRFVKADVPKRPLSQESHFVEKKTEVAKIKSRKIGSRKPVLSVEKPVEKSAKKPTVSSGKTSDKTEGAKNKGVYKVPRSPFINQDKVVKRPLSKNVYQKKVEAPQEKPKGPVTIISKPEKPAHVGLIVAIILTIILGAAAGTVAFLLLPK